MANGHGGARPGAGRKGKAKFATEIQAAERLIADKLPELVGQMFALAAGVQVEKVDKEGGVDIYMTPPDFKANAYLIDRILGKPTQAVEVTGEDGGPIELDATIRAEAEREIRAWREKMRPNADGSTSSTPSASPTAPTSSTPTG